MGRAGLRELAANASGAESAGPYVFLTDPAWGGAEKCEVERLMDQAKALRQGSEERSTGWLCVPTGGTSGRIKFARHDEETVIAAVEAYRAYFGFDAVNAVGLLPRHHVSGLMAAARSLYSGGQYMAADWRMLQHRQWPVLPNTAEGWVISLVPTQLQRLLAVPGGGGWLAQFRVVHVGGGPMWPALAEAAATARVRVAQSYGMTETAAMVASQKPEAFVSGERDVGFTLPHAVIELTPVAGSSGVDQDDSTADRTGLITVRAKSLFRGYFPELIHQGAWQTEDVGMFGPTGGLQVLGRRDAVIITGGKKVWPDEVEALLRATGAFQDVVVLGMPDPEWGERVTACYAGEPMAPEQIASIEAQLGQSLARYKLPKRFEAVWPWPMNAQGKVNRARLRELIRTL